MQSTIITLALLASFAHAKVVTEEVQSKAKSLVEVKSKLASKYAQAQSCSKKGMFILEGMKMEAVKRENELQAAEETGGPSLKHAIKMDALMKMAMKGFQEKHSKFQEGLGNLQDQLEKEQTNKEAEILDKNAEKEYEEFKKNFDLHGSSLMEADSSAEHVQVETSTVLSEDMAQQADSLLKEIELMQEEAGKQSEADATTLASLAHGVKSKTEVVMANLAQEAAKEEEKLANLDAKMTTVKEASHEEAMMDEAIMMFLLNPTVVANPVGSLAEKPEMPFDGSFMNHRLVKSKGLEAPEQGTQQVVLDKVLKDMEKSGELAIASVDLDSLPHDSQVQMHLHCLKAFVPHGQKLFIDVNGGSRQRRERVKSMALMAHPQAKSLDKLKNAEAEDYTYKLADKLFKIGDFKKAASAVKKQQLNSDKAEKLVANGKASKDKMCSVDAHKQQKQMESLYKPYFGDSKLAKVPKMLKTELAKIPQAAAPSMRRASSMKM